MSTYTKIENCKAEIKHEVEKETWLNAQTKAFDKLAKKVEVKGFRKGQAPKELVKKQISSQQIMMEAVDTILQNEFTKCLAEHDVELIDQPQLNIDTINENELKLTFKLSTAPDVELKKYKGFGYTLPEIYITDDEVDAEIKKMRERYANLEVKEGMVENGDTAIIDYEGFKDGVAFEGGKAENYALEIGSHTFIPGFEEQIIGMKTGEEKEINVTFPEEYQAEELKGQAVIFKIKLNDIKTKVLPEIDEEFFEVAGLKDIKDEAGLKKYLHEQLLNTKKSEAENKADDEMFEKLISANEIDVPEIMIKHEAEDMLNEFAQRISYQGMKLEDYLKYFGQTKEGLLASYQVDAEKRIKLRLLIKAIVVKEKFEVSDEEVEKELQAMADMYKMPIEEVKKYLNAESVKGDLVSRKAVQFIKEN
ncbi:MAG: trigger factor [Erysipelotrichaceae bacterium]|nr:trigger factor [Erysipelotrichaceae bacterium]